MVFFVLFFVFFFFFCFLVEVVFIACRVVSAKRIVLLEVISFDHLACPPLRPSLSDRPPLTQVGILRPNKISCLSFLHSVPIREFKSVIPAVLSVCHSSQGFIIIRSLVIFQVSPRRHPCYIIWQCREI